MLVPHVHVITDPYQYRYFLWTSKSERNKSIYSKLHGSFTNHTVVLNAQILCIICIHDTMLQMAPVFE